MTDLGPGPPALAAGTLLSTLPLLRVVRAIHRSKHCDVYEVLDEGRGGARFAAKIVRPDRRDETETVARILVEGVRLACIEHPSVLRCVQTIDEPPGNLLEYVEGRSLASALHDGRPRPWREVAELGAQLASALEAVHATGLLHCDVKPANILVARDGERYVLIDLDLARPPGLTSGGRGTRHYMAPEQAAGGLIGPEIDAWGLGMVLFAAATGAHAFSADEDYPQTEFQPHLVGELRRGGDAVAAIIDALLSPVPRLRPLLGWVEAELARQAALRTD